MSIHERLERRYVPEPNSGCWLWLGPNATGYGQIKLDGKVRLAHRVSYELAKGPIPGGLEIDHLCRVRCCVNPNHLEAVTRRVNQLRGRGAAGTNSRKATCKRGHAFDRRYADGKRRCLACKRQLRAELAELEGQ